MRRRGELVPATVELTPLIDVVLLLLVFFVVSTSFVRENQLGLELPKASGAAPVVDTATVAVTVLRDGSYRVNGEAVATTGQNSLPEVLGSAAARLGPSRVRLLVAADAQTSHQAVVRVLEAASRIGLTRVSMVTRSTGEAAQPMEGVPTGRATHAP